jgi:peptidoglycan hydrolase-like protein with peptidoglycan-binding domain
VTNRARSVANHWPDRRGHATVVSERRTAPRSSHGSQLPSSTQAVRPRNLNFCYGTKLAVDGIYGSNTRAVVKMVQRKHKLVADGIYGP